MSLFDEVLKPNMVFISKPIIFRFISIFLASKFSNNKNIQRITLRLQPGKKKLNSSKINHWVKVIA